MKKKLGLMALLGVVAVAGLSMVPTSAVATSVLVCPKGVTDHHYCTLKTCPHAQGSLTEREVGSLALGMSQSRARKLFLIVTTRGRKYIDYYCLTPIGERAGYPSPFLLRNLTKRRRASLTGHVIMALSANTQYKLDGVKPGTKWSKVSSKLNLIDHFNVGKNTWYLTPNGASNGVFKVNNGFVGEVGIVNKSLTSTHSLGKDFFRSFNNA